MSLNLSPPLLFWVCLLEAFIVFDYKSVRVVPELSRQNLPKSKQLLFCLEDKTKQKQGPISEFCSTSKCSSCLFDPSSLPPPVLMDNINLKPHQRFLYKIIKSLDTVTHLVSFSLKQCKIYGSWGGLRASVPQHAIGLNRMSSRRDPLFSARQGASADAAVESSPESITRPPVDREDVLEIDRERGGLIQVCSGGGWHADQTLTSRTSSGGTSYEIKREGLRNEIDFVFKKNRGRRRRSRVCRLA